MFMPIAFTLVQGVRAMEAKNKATAAGVSRLPTKSGLLASAKRNR
jgi:hypothetical protein